MSGAQVAVGGPVDGVLFDVDDTLVDTRGAFAVAWHAVAGTYLPHLDDAELPAVVAHWRADPGGYYARFAAGRLGYAAQRLARVNELHGVFGGPVLDEAAFAAWNEDFEAGFQSGWAAWDDAEAALESVRGAGLPSGALTNAAAGYQRLKLDRSGLGGLPVLVGVDTLGFGKPDPRVFAEACRLLGTAPERTVYVGDELRVDAVAARAAGLPAVWLDRPGAPLLHASDADVAAALGDGVVRIEGLGELPGVLGLR